MIRLLRDNKQAAAFNTAAYCSQPTVTLGLSNTHEAKGKARPR